MDKGLLCSTGNSAPCYVAAWMGGEFGGEQIHVYVWLRPFAGHLKLSQHCESFIPKYKIKRFKKNMFFLCFSQPVIFCSFQFNTCSDQCCHCRASLAVVCLPSLHLVIVSLLSFTWQSNACTMQNIQTNQKSITHNYAKVPHSSMPLRYPCSSALLNLTFE